MSQLTVYKASAGSGKTFKLTEEYLRLLFMHPFNYRHILAVTFTNKATAEMKGRIIEELHNLATGKKTGYINIFTKELRFSETELQQKARYILNHLLHDFSRFSIGTIDSFFQKVMQSFVREIGLQLGFNLELDNERVLVEAAKQLWLEVNDNVMFKNWLINFAESKIEQGSNWNFQQDIVRVGKEVFRETFQQFSTALIKKLSDKSFLTGYIAKLQKIVNSFENTLSTLGKQALDIIENYSLEFTDFSYGKAGVAGYFKKLHDKCGFEPGKRAIDAINNVEKWYSKKTSYQEEIIAAFNNGLNDLLIQSVNYYNDHAENYYTAQQISSNIYTLGLLTDITKKIRQYAWDENLFLLSDVGKLLYEVINENPTPFVYEKLGNYIRHFMIDEFQDTSEMQWRNFMPLIQDSLAEDNKSLVVGDVKQSIYRWRNSNWQILASEIEKEFQHFGIDKNSLDFNWRSKKNVIHFNNILFSAGARILQESYNQLISGENMDDKTIVNAYDDIIQKVPDGAIDGGMVYYNFVEDDDIQWKDLVLSKLPSVINRLYDSGIRLKDIAILVRRKDEGKQIADYILQGDKPRFSIISDEALYISSSIAVQIIMAALKFLSNPRDEINKTFLVNSIKYYIDLSGDNISEIVDFNDFQEIFEELNRFKSNTLYEIVENVKGLFKLSNLDGQLAYISAFQDIVHEYSIKNSPDINYFINWWEEEGIKKALPANETIDAVRILTIHKSKGLEFKAVIIPFCDWTFDHHSSQRNIIWCRPCKKPFNELDLVPVTYSKKLADTIFSEDYYQERLKSFVDNLNLLYVAFTRAEDVLIAYGPERKKDELKNVSDLVKSVFNQKPSFENSAPIFSETEQIYKCYDKEKKHVLVGKLDETDEIMQSENVELLKNMAVSISYHDKLFLKYNSADYFTVDESSNLSKINYGLLMHEVFEKIDYLNDVDRIIGEMEISGKITAKQGVELKERLDRQLDNPVIRDWFSDKWERRTEASILMETGAILRPDRILIRNDKAVIIDFKFGNMILEKYEKQVRRYMDCLKNMGYLTINGYLWYFDIEKVVEVK